MVGRSAQRGLAAAVAVFALVLSTAGAAPAQDAGFAHEAGDLEPDPRVLYGALENGFRYAIMPNDTPEGAAAMLLSFAVGSLMESEAERGYAHLLEHMAFNGSANVPEGEMGRILQRHGLAFGADVNASTSHGRTTYMLQLPRTDAETLHAGFLLFGELDALTLADDAVASERDVVLAEIRLRNVPPQRIADARMAFLYPRSLLGDRSVGGKPESVGGADAAALRAFYERNYTPGRAFLVVVGDVEPAEIEARIDAAFGDWAARETVTPDPGKIGFDTPAAAVFVEVGMPSTVTIHAVKPARDEPDSRAARERELALLLANAILTQRMRTRALTEGEAVLNGQAGQQTQENLAELGTVSAQVRAGAWREGLTMAENELRRTLEHGFTRSELNEQTARMRSQIATATTQADATHSMVLAQRILSQFSADDVHTAPGYDLALFDEIVAGLTPERVRQAFRAIWADAPPAIFIVDAAAIEGGAETILAAWADAGAQPVEAPEEGAEVAFAYEDFGQAGTIVSREDADDLGIVRIRFANNVMLNVMQADRTPGSVSAIMAFGGGALEFPQNQPELRHLISGFGMGGTGAHSLEDLRRILAGRSISSGFLLGGDSFVAVAPSLPEGELLTQMQVWAAYLTDPGFRPEGFTQMRRDYDARVGGMDVAAQGVMTRNMAAILQNGKNIPFPPPETLDRLDAEVARAALARALEQGTIEISMAGDISVEAAADAVARTLGALPAREAQQPPFTEERTMTMPGPGVTTLTHTGPADSAAALIAWPTVDASDHARARRLETLAQILQLRVTEQVREEAGASYASFVLASMAEEFPGYGYISVRTDVTPDDIDAVLGVIEAAAADLAAGEATQDELDRAVRPLIEARAQQKQQNLFWAQAIMRAQSFPERLGRVRGDEADFAAITLDEITALAAEYFDPAKAVYIKVLPEAAD